jgi:hypothetical protein
MGTRFAVDTNVLRRLSELNHPQFSLISGLMRLLVAEGAELCFTPQNLGEFWNASTRPLAGNGLGHSLDETRHLMDSIERRMTLLTEDERATRFGGVC